MAVTTDNESLLFTFTVRVINQHPVNISFFKKTSAEHYRDRISLAVLESN